MPEYCTPDPEIKRLLLREGDLLFNRTNSPELVGKSGIFHGTQAMSFASYLIRVRFRDGIADPDYVNFWLNSAWGRAWAQQAKTDGVSQSNINGTKLSAMPLPLPPIDEQREIVRQASRMLATADAVLDKIAAASRRVDAISGSVIASAMRNGLGLESELQQGSVVAPLDDADPDRVA